MKTAAALCIAFGSLCVSAVPELVFQSEGQPACSLKAGKTGIVSNCAIFDPEIVSLETRVQDVEEGLTDRIQALETAVCSVKHPGCTACSADYSTCAMCSTGLYRKDNGKCGKCSDAIKHCEQCADNSTCQVCAAHSEGVQSNGACYAPATCATYGTSAAPPLPDSTTRAY
jgi:hypothetical protein